MTWRHVIRAVFMATLTTFIAWTVGLQIAGLMVAVATAALYLLYVKHVQ